MADLSSNRIAWTYTDDNGLNWRVAAVKAWTDQAKQGGAAALPSVLPKPSSIKMRRITVRDGAGHSRVVPVYDATGPAITVTGATFNFNANVAGVITTVTGTSTGHVIPEERRASNITTQSS